MNDPCEIERTLARNSRELLFGDLNPDLKAALLGALGNVSDAYVIDWIPEQGVNIYTVIVPPDKHVVIEVPRRGFEQEEQVAIEVSRYDRTMLNTKGIGREKRDKLRAVASLIAKCRTEN